jgi:hypothetical protein
MTQRKKNVVQKEVLLHRNDSKKEECGAEGGVIAPK